MVSDEKHNAQLEPAASFDPATADPDELRDRVRQALLKLSVSERMAVRDQLLARLQQAGVNIGNALFALGITAERSAELMPSDLAYLIRYVRINSSEKLRTVAELLKTLLSSGNKKTGSSRLAA